MSELIRPICFFLVGVIVGASCNALIGIIAKIVSDWKAFRAWVKEEETRLSAIKTSVEAAAKIPPAESTK